MFTKLPTVLPGSILDWKHGWLPNGFADHCREIVNTYINDLVSKEMRDSRKNNSPKVSSDSASESSTSDSEISEGDIKKPANCYFCVQGSWTYRILLH